MTETLSRRQMKVTMALIGIAAVAMAVRAVERYHHIHVSYLFLPVIKVLLLAGGTIRLITAMPDEPEKYGQAYMTFLAVLLMMRGITKLQSR